MTQRRPSHGWNATNAILAAAPYVPPPWLVALRQREAARQERIAAWRASQAPRDRGPFKKFNPVGTQDPRLPEIPGGDVPPGGTPAEIAEFNAKMLRRNLAVHAYDYVERKRNRQAGVAPGPMATALANAMVTQPSAIDPKNPRIPQDPRTGGNGDRSLAVGALPSGKRP